MSSSLLPACTWWTVASSDQRHNASGAEPFLPPPLRGADGGFTLDSIVRRLPLIIDEIRRYNEELPPACTLALGLLKQDILRNSALSPLEAAFEPEADWVACAASHARSGETWTSAPWFFVENYLYRRILAVMQQTGGPPDPFLTQKQRSLEASRDAFVRDVLPLFPAADTRAMLVRCLWGNRADLSLFTLEALARGGGTEVADRILCDDSEEASRAMDDAASFAIVLDNAGLELLTDLVVAAALLARGDRTGRVATVTLWAKSSPVFVSDALIEDVAAHIDWIEGAVNSLLATTTTPVGSPAASLARVLREAGADGRLSVRHDPYWTSPLPIWSMPEHLRAEFSRYDVALVKGDANYRRLTGDRHWRHAEPFAAVVGASFPCACVALRTCKSGVAVGVSEKEEQRAAGVDTHWLTDGEWGLIQWKP